MELNLDANEVMHSLTERVDDRVDAGTIGNVPDLEIKTKQRDKLDREIEKLKVETECARKQLEKEPRPVTEIAGPNTGRKVELPRLELPTFSGIITEWPTFWDSFSSTIHSDKSLSDIDKFKYLMSILEGEARDTLLGFNLTNAEYEEAIEHLCERYDEKEYAELANLVKCGNVTSELRKTFNFIEIQLRSIECMSENINNNYIVGLIKAKLPDSLHVRLW